MWGRRDGLFDQSTLPLNSLTNVAAWNDPDWRAVSRLLGLSQDEGWFHRKAFEWTHCIDGLERLHALGPDKRVLGVAAGHECTLYYLANRSLVTVATDLYRGGFADSHAQEANPDFLARPQDYAPFPYRTDRLLPLPADALRLPFDDDSFDVVYSLSSIEHFGGHDRAAEAVREMARVLRPGGVACVATEYVLRGPQHDEYFNARDLDHWVIGASGDLRLVEPLDRTEPPQEFFDDPVPLPDDPFHHPHVVLQAGPTMFTSVVLFFEKRHRSAGRRFQDKVRRLTAR
jgi:SAM-dependent methyltransferase